MTRCPRCGAALGASGVCAACLASAGDEPVLLAGSFELEEPIGEGGMGQVWRARHRRLGRTVAVKLLPLELAASEEFRRRFEREAQALARLAHPGIVTVHDFGEEDGQYYLVMEYAEGGTLATRMPMPAEQAVRHALELAEALSYAHGHGIVHRDIKPANVLLSAEGRAKLTDFGVARFIGPHSGGWTVTQPDKVAGTPLYLAPEVLEGAAPDPRQDLYALGVLLYEMVTGTRPQGDFAPLAGPLDAVVRRLLAPDPARRHASAAELAEALRALVPARTPAQPVPAAVPDDERIWQHAAALIHTVCTAIGLWAVFLCVTPRVIPASEAIPLVMIDPQPLPGGRLVSWARFEIGPLLAAFAAIGFCAIVYQLLEMRWRRAGIFRDEGPHPVEDVAMVLRLGVACAALFAVHLALQAAWPIALLRYVPIPGGILELLVVYYTWSALLETQRRRRSWFADWRLWAGVALALVPPVTDFARYLAYWVPR